MCNKGVFLYFFNLFFFLNTAGCKSLIPLSSLTVGVIKHIAFVLLVHVTCQYLLQKLEFMQFKAQQKKTNEQYQTKFVRFF